MWILRIIVLLFVMSSCARVPKEDNEKVASLVKERVGAHIAQHDDVARSIAHLVESELSKEAAVQIALLNNPHLQASFEALGIARADIVQAGLLQNPVFSGYLRFADSRGTSNNVELSLTQSFIDVFMIPVRQKVASYERDRVELELAGKMIDVAFRVEELFYALQLELAREVLLHELVEAYHLGKLIAERQFAASNINELELRAKVMEYEQHNMLLFSVKRSINALKSELKQVLGLKDEELKISANLIAPSGQEKAIDQLEAQALSKRLELSEVRLEVKKIVAMGDEKKWWAYTDPAAGLSYEKDADSIEVFGPTLAFSLPLFDCGEAARLRLISMLKQTLKRQKAIELDIVHEVKQSKDNVDIHRSKALYIQDVMIPEQERVVSMSQEYYNVMGLDVYRLLSYKIGELEIKMDYIAALKEYWQAKIALERAVGGCYL